MPRPLMKAAWILMGAGASYDLGNNIGVRAEWERYKDVGTPKSKGRHRLTQRRGNIFFIIKN